MQLPFTTEPTRPFSKAQYFACQANEAQKQINDILFSNDIFSSLEVAITNNRLSQRDLDHIAQLQEQKQSMTEKSHHWYWNHGTCPFDRA